MEPAASEVGDVVLVCGECGPEPPGTGEAFARCHRRRLKDVLLAVAADRGLVVDPDTDALNRTLLEARRTEVPAAVGIPLTGPVDHRPAATARAIRGRRRVYGYGSAACLEVDVARWKAQLWPVGRRGRRHRHQPRPRRPVPGPPSTRTQPPHHDRAAPAAAYRGVPA